MDRRNFLKMSASIAAGLGIGSKECFAKAGDVFTSAAFDERPIEAGWVKSTTSRRVFIARRSSPFLNQLDDDIRGTGKGKVALLWPFFEQMTGHPLVPHFQEIGDCISHGFGLGVDLLTAIQILMRGAAQEWRNKVATEIIYGGSRVEIGRGQYDIYFRGDGSTGHLAAEFLKNYGVLLREVYPGGYDFREYSGDLARTLGKQGVPNELEPLCKIHPVGCVSLVQSYEEYRDCIYNGFPVALCSSQGFVTRGGRDKDGFLYPSRNPWMHCMLGAGVDDQHKRPGGLIINSWGSNWISGPKRHDQPDGSFWADAAVIDRICKQGDSIALSCYAGYPRQDYILW